MDRLPLFPSCSHQGLSASGEDPAPALLASVSPAIKWDDQPGHQSLVEAEGRGCWCWD